jgi:hypothetical protein
MFGRVTKFEVGLGAILLYGVSVSLLGGVRYPTFSGGRLACLALVYVAGARIVGGIARTNIKFPPVARAAVFAGCTLPGAVIVAVTGASAVLGLGPDAVLDASHPIQLGTFSTPRLLNSGLGATFLGHTSFLALLFLGFAAFRWRSGVLRTLIVGACLGYGAILFWSGSRTAVLAGWVCFCCTLLLLARLARRSHVRRRAACGLAVALLLPIGGFSVVSRFVSRSSLDTMPDLSDLYQSERGQYRDNALRWIGESGDISTWGAGLGAANVITREITSTSVLQKNVAFGIIEPFFPLVIFEWGFVGAGLYTAYWLWLSWVVFKGDFRDLRMGRPWAGLASSWLLYIWASSVTGFGFGIVGTTPLLMFALCRLATGHGQRMIPNRIDISTKNRTPRPHDERRLVFTK